jgi:hypothetical protein
MREKYVVQRVEVPQNEWDREIVLLPPSVVLVLLPVALQNDL